MSWRSKFREISTCFQVSFLSVMKSGSLFLASFLFFKVNPKRVWREEFPLRDQCGLGLPAQCLFLRGTKPACAGTGGS